MASPSLAIITIDCSSPSAIFFDKAKVMYQSLEKSSFQFEHC
ncbi:hypothetical protein CIPAW_11G130400 [Carya illinoinensis]|uniref:Uncharacterized protein n=1 Tax=Carya illinoinensis TaxID=32201 RepID=A0A8T1NYT9_CARIL|nr:hypothetical protein CIPAW_11G130400 [Carya illinoinensis]